MNLARAWQRIHRSNLAGTVYANPAPIDPKHPKAPKHVPLPKGHTPSRAQTFEAGVVRYCARALGFAGKMVYSMGGDRSQLFAHKPGDFEGAHADCSQFVSAIAHWLGCTWVTATDWTGSLLEKAAKLGKLRTAPAVGLGAVFGPNSGEHIGWITGKTPDGMDWYVVGFGWSGAPDRSTLSGMLAYFEARGFPGVRYIDFA